MENTPLSNAKTITTSQIIHAYKIYSLGVVLSTSATINVWLYDDQDNNIGTKTFILEGPEYLQWGTDDSFINTFIQGKISALISLN